MADYDQIMKALRNADAAGDTAAAQRLARMAAQAKAGLGQPSTPQLEEVFADEKGGKVYRLGDGSLSYASPGFSTNDPNRIKQIMGGAAPKNLVQGDYDRAVIEQTPAGAVGGVVVKATQGLPGGKWIDEAADKIAPGAGEGIRQVAGAMDRQRPKTALASEIGGAVLGGSLLPGTSTVAGAAAEGAAYAALDASGAADGGDRINAAKDAAMAGALFGAGSKVALNFGSKAFQRLFNKSAERPTIESLRATKNAAYNAVDSSGEKFSPDDMKGLYQRILANLDASDFDDIADPQTAASLKMFERRQGEELTIGRLDKLRQTLWGRYSRGGEKLILDMIDEVDDLIESRAGTSDLMDAARLANSRYKKAEMLENAFQRAERETAASGSGGNILNKYRQAVTKILNNPKSAKWFNAGEIEVMEKFVRGSMSENALRRIGKLSPSGNGLMMALNLGAAAADPSMLAFTAAGAGAKEAADQSVERGRNRLLSTVSGHNPARPRVTSPGAANALAGLLGSEAVR
ncbi:hypothetical protein ACSSNL_18115 [Thalassobius sp. S69A]|uniref:hypothetical protein n=1 Tax=unclassified Thalassovita TaxID=2619711 RepID=UPI003C79D39F